MKLLLFMMIIGVHLSDSIAQVSNSEVVIMKAHDLQASVEICRGIAIHPKVVMTAAECVDGLLFTDLLVEHLRYLLIADVSNVIIHPEYTVCNGSNNFAILITESVITIENSIACLPDETFLNNVNLYNDCSNKLITTKLSTKFLFDVPKCLILSRIYRLENIPSQICGLSYEDTPDILKSRQVKMSICKSYAANSKCLVYYFAHETTTEVCTIYNEGVPFHHLTSYVYNVIPWIQYEIKKYINGVPQEFACVLILIICIVTHLFI